MAYRQDGKWILTDAEYQQLTEDSEFLNKLHEAGVNNWSGYGEWDYEEDCE